MSAETPIPFLTNNEGKFVMAEASLPKTMTRGQAKLLKLRWYFTGVPCIRNHLSLRQTVNGRCKECRNIARRNSLNEKKSAREYNLRKKIENPLKTLVNNARCNSRRKNIPFDLVWEDLVLPKYCPCCGKEMKPRIGDWGQGGHPDSASLDRFDNNRGYFLDNVNIICWRCNEIKRNASTHELRTVLTWMEKMEQLQIA